MEVDCSDDMFGWVHYFPTQSQGAEAETHRLGTFAAMPTAQGQK